MQYNLHNTDDRNIPSCAGSLLKITWLGLAANLALSVFKFYIGWLSSSISLINDSIHSLTDMGTDILVLIGIHYGIKEADSSHPFGHGKIETFSGFLVACALLVAGIAATGAAAIKFFKPSAVQMTWPVVTAALISIGVKEFLYRISIREDNRCNSEAVKANAWHHRTDAFSSIAVLGGALSYKIGFLHGDAAAGIIVGIMVMWAAISIGKKTFDELVESSADKKTIDTINKTISSHPMVKSHHKLRSRKLGRTILLDVHVLVDPLLTIEEAHRISDEIQTNLQKAFPRGIDATIHMEPDLPQFRK